MPFIPYIAKNRLFEDFRFDFHVVNETGKLWYDGSPDQWMQERDWCVRRLRQGMTVVDCGAHHGMMSLIFANAVGPGGKVFAYEPLASNAQVVVQNAALNKLSNIFVRPVGVGNSNTSMSALHNLSNTVIVQSATDSICRVEDMVEIVRLDDDLPDGIRIDFIKIDVEGHDLYALQGMQETLKQLPAIDLELHNFIFEDKISTLTQIVLILSPLAYNWELMGEIIDKPVNLGRSLDVHQLARFSNPHLFGMAERKQSTIEPTTN